MISFLNVIDNNNFITGGYPARIFNRKAVLYGQVNIS